MSSLKNTTVEIEEWIIKVINSCTTIEQITLSRKLIDLYCQKLLFEIKLSSEIREHLKDNLLKHYKNTKLRLIRQIK